MQLDEFKILVDDPSKKDMDLMNQLTELLENGSDIGREGVAYLKENRPKLFAGINMLFKSIGLEEVK